MDGFSKDVCTFLYRPLAFPPKLKQEEIPQMINNNNNININDIRTILVEAIRSANLIDDKLSESPESYRQQTCVLFASVSIVLDLLEEGTKVEPPIDFSVSVSYLLLSQKLRRYELTDNEDGATRIVWAASVENIKRHIENNRTDLMGNRIEKTEVDQWQLTDLIIPNTPANKDTTVLIPCSALDNYLASFQL